MASIVPICEKRWLFMMLSRQFQEPEQSFFLFGPRGVGKSTLLKMLHPDALWIDLLRPQVLRTYLARPEYLYEFIAGNPDKHIVIIDEIQKAPSLLTIIHGLIKEKRHLKFILTGSSARKLKRTAADLLAGRALKRALHPFMACELKDQFSLTRALSQGLLPLVVTGKNAADILETYISLYLQQEIQAEGLVRNLEAFSRFLEVVSFSHASILNITNVARECEIKRKTVENYIDILKELMLADTIEVFSKRAQRQLSAHPKFYLFDSGVFYHLHPKGFLDKPAEIEGLSLEGLVFQHLRAWCDYTSKKHDVYFWRTRSGLEVDFIVYGEMGLWALEVKHSSRISSTDLSGLKAFSVDYPEATCILLYQGIERSKRDNIWCLPCENFLKTIIPHQPIH